MIWAYRVRGFVPDPLPALAPPRFLEQVRLHHAEQAQQPVVGDPATLRRVRVVPDAQACATATVEPVRGLSRPVRVHVGVTGEAAVELGGYDARRVARHGHRGGVHLHPRTVGAATPNAQVGVGDTQLGLYPRPDGVVLQPCFRVPWPGRATPQLSVPNDRGLFSSSPLLALRTPPVVTDSGDAPFNAARARALVASLPLPATNSGQRLVSC